MQRLVLVLILVLAMLPADLAAKSYSSGSRSYSSSRSSASGGGSRSSSSRSSSSKSYSSGSGRTYSSGSSSSSRPPSSNRDTSSGSAKTYSAPSGNSHRSSASGFSFDTGAAKAQKKETSQKDFNVWRQKQDRESSPTPSSRGAESPSQSWPSDNSNRRPSYSTPVDTSPYVPSPPIYATRRVRLDRYFTPYYSRPTLVFHDSYNNFFWWWLLDRSLEDRAMWAYSHRSTMDTARYQALLATDTNLEARVRQLELEATPVNPRYVPAGMDADLMYSDSVIHRAYVTRPTLMGRIFFWMFMTPILIGVAWFLVWFIFYKHWTATQ